MTTRPPEYQVTMLDDMPQEDIPSSVPAHIELGVTGLKRFSGVVDEEFLPALRGRKAIQIYREMSQNDSIVGALLFAVDKLIREAEWKVTPPDQTPESREAAEFLESNMHDMSHSWGDFVTEIMSMLTYGWSWHELVYKRRVGPWEKDAKYRSKYTDNRIGWRKLPIRAQETWFRWVFDDTGGIRAMVQMAPPSYQAVVIPIEKSLLFRTNISKGNPEGQSILRTAYRSWYFKKRLEEFEGIGVERDLAGMPVARVPADYLSAAKGTKQEAVVAGFRKMVRGVRRDENEGLVIPTQYDPDTKQPLFDFELMSAGGSRQFDTNSIIQRYEQRILMTVLADFILVGHQSTGSYSLHTDKTGIFRAAMNAVTDAVADTLNRHAVPRLFELNAWKPDELPKIEVSEIDPPDLQQLAALISATAGAGMQWFPDPELEKFIRTTARVPEIPDDMYELKQEQSRKQQVMDYAASQMEFLGMQQKAELVGRGFSPEQAQMQSESPNSEMQQQMATAEMDGEQARREHPVGQEDAAREQEQMETQMALEQQKLMPEEDSPAAQAQHMRDQEKAGWEEQRAQADHVREKQTFDLQQRMADKDLKREKEKATLGERNAHKTHIREKDKARLQDRMEREKHKRETAKMKEQGRQAAKQAKFPPKKKK